MATMNSTQETILKNWVNNNLDLTLDILAREFLIREENEECCTDSYDGLLKLFRDLDLEPIPDEDFEICAYEEGFIKNRGEEEEDDEDE